jgi:hypothetical protein
VVFATLNIPGSENNVGYDSANDAEASCRDRANARWLEQAVAEAAPREIAALVVLIQADPWETSKPQVYRAFLEQLVSSSRRLGKPVLFVHGDTHVYRADTPFTDALGQPLANPSRLETFGSPFVGWVEVTVDPDSPAVFRFQPHLHAVVGPR